jgi:hypothetical protein
LLKNNIVDPIESPHKATKKKKLFNFGADLKHPMVLSEKSHLTIVDAMNIIDTKLKSPFERWAKSRLDQQLESVVKCCKKVARKLPGGDVTQLPPLKVPAYGKKLPGGGRLSQVKELIKTTIGMNGLKGDQHDE